MHVEISGTNKARCIYIYHWVISFGDGVKSVFVYVSPNVYIQMNLCDYLCMQTIVEHVKYTEQIFFSVLLTINLFPFLQKKNQLIFYPTYQP